MLIRLQRIYNLWSIHVVILSFLGVLQSFYSNFISFFGTNLLTQCPVPVVVFCLFFTSHEINIKRSPNTAKLAGDYLWTRTPKMSQSRTWGVPQGGTTHQGAPGASVASRTPSLHYKFPNILKPFGVNLDEKFRRRKASVSTRSNLDTVPAPCRRGESSPVAIFIIPAATTMRRE